MTELRGKTQRSTGVKRRGVVRLRVRVVEGPDAGAVLEPELPAKISVGVSSDNDLVLTDPTVSRYHLELERVDAGVEVRDLDSLNGTLLGDVALKDAVVPAGTTIRAGDTVLVIEDGEAVEPPKLEPVALPGIVGESEAIRRVAKEVDRLASANVSVFIHGETGTGKELFARALHDLGPRKDGPFVVVDCGSMPPTLIASELFGHEKGAFTGAEVRQIGAFERAHKGTVFLDEIGELPLSLQPALLGALERRRFRRVGGDKEINVDVRIVSASNRDLRAEVNRGNFRADLFFRLAVARLVLPALRERREDVPVLIAHFVREVTGDPNASPFSPATIEALKNHPWSGNVRELRNVVESALALGHLPASEEAPASSSAKVGREEGALDGEAGSGAIPLYREARADVISTFERDYLTKLMAHCEGNVSKASRVAKMDRPYLLSLLKRHGLR